ncbi:helix-turn-helix domain-containing protein [Chitinophagaceae bacterium LB-8]|uniref:Helix-turn-helix domain-containing protein n=1 Tax=Paraflavisolibacter caeni TaxID=2982496 RepID=A0A9X2XY98_9BACT|nr:helix-turn-helix domain-containing protein [Paraflavisolibacter caeni]MCU7550962.1 helix-turn-helix domain-containing protein [Paraflavisolibacter caeni]
MSRNIILQGLTVNELENLIKKVVAEQRLTEVALLSKQVPSQKETTYLSRKQVSKKLNLSLPTLAKYSSEGLIPSYRIGKRILYREDEVIKALEVVQTQKFKKL